jgi:hypothetical protein
VNALYQGAHAAVLRRERGPPRGCAPIRTGSPIKTSGSEARPRPTGELSPSRPRPARGTRRSRRILSRRNEIPTAFRGRT